MMSENALYLSSFLKFVINKNIVTVQNQNKERFHNVIFKSQWYHFFVNRMNGDLHYHENIRDKTH